jgi:DNA (cytosine-5)-methyltransferase 1
MSKQKQLVEASVSLFSSAGIGDLGIEYGCGIEVSISAELLPQRVKLLRHNYPKCTVFEGDITVTAPMVIEGWKKKHSNARPLLITLSPPCQGMSTNGAGKIAAEVKKGNRPQEDERNKLLIPGLKVVKSLQPEFFLVENVPNMKNTVISWKRNKPKRLIELIPTSVGTGYEIHSFVIDFANYGVPHHRKRLITIGRRTGAKKSTLSEHSKPPHWFNSGSESEQISVSEAIGNLLRTKKSDPLHRSPKMNERHIFWASHIPKNSGNTAHMNACLNMSCKHIDEFRVVVCTKCGELLPRPHVIQKDGVVRAIKGYKTSYRRMSPHSPANTITMNSGVPSSDVKLHYNQARVLTLKEIMVLSTFHDITNKKTTQTAHKWAGKYSFDCVMAEKDYILQKNIIRQSLGESIPPLAMQRMVKSLIGDWPE